MKKQASKTVPVKPSGMKKGGPTGMAMKAVGRNMARANNQKGK
jgi:hypothetical protein